MASDKITLVLIVLAVLVLNSTGVINLGGLMSSGGDSVATADQTGTLCLNDGSVMTIGPADYRYRPTTSVTDQYHRVFVDGIDRGLKIDGTTMDVTTPTRIGGTDGSAVEIYYAENSTDFYASKHVFSVPCVSAFASGARPDSDAYKLVANSTTRTSLAEFNDDDALSNNCGTQNESIAADDSSNIDIKVTFPSKSGMSPYGDVIFSVLYNTSAYDEIELTSSDTVISEATVPQFRQSDNGSTGFGWKAFKFAGVEGMTTTIYRFNLYVESGSNDPTKGVAMPSADIRYFLDDQDYYLNSDTGIMELGAEDNDDNDVGATTVVSETICVQ